jgi:ATP-dependent 26S proteasome regulatory subunit
VHNWFTERYHPLEKQSIAVEKGKMLYCSPNFLKTISYSFVWIIGDDKTIPKDPLTLSFLLNLIDGIIEQPSRILIMTTNHPEQIDPALLRPGRVDIKQEFKRCTKPIIKEMIEFFFNQESQIDASQLRDYAYSPAEIISVCMSTSTGKSAVQLLAEQVLPNVVVEAEKTLACNEQWSSKKHSWSF